MKSAQLLSDLRTMTQQHLVYVEELLDMPIAKLAHRPHSDRWNILENIEHLSLYSDFYLPEIDQAMAKSSSTAVEEFKSGWLGAYFVNAMIPGPESKKMKTFKDKDTIGHDLNKLCVERFAGQLRTTLTLLDRASKVDLNKVKTGITISKLVRIKLGDILRVVIYHNDRHMEQIKGIRKS